MCINIKRKHNIIFKINTFTHVKCPEDLFIIRTWVIFKTIFGFYHVSNVNLYCLGNNYCITSNNYNRRKANFVL